MASTSSMVFSLVSVVVLYLRFSAVCFLLQVFTFAFLFSLSLSLSLSPSSLGELCCWVVASRLIKAFVVLFFFFGSGFDLLGVCLFYVLQSKWRWWSI